MCLVNFKDRKGSKGKIRKVFYSFLSDLQIIMNLNFETKSVG